MSREIMEQALDALKNGKLVREGEGGTQYQPDLEEKAIAALEAELAKPEQEPVCWITPDGEGFRMRYEPPVNDVPMGWTPLYTAPPKREFVGLTDDECKEIGERVVKEHGL